jgi:hypothetical protein
VDESAFPRASRLIGAIHSLSGVVQRPHSLIDLSEHTKVGVQAVSGRIAVPTGRSGRGRWSPS